jgi:hypothetical protein
MGDKPIKSDYIGLGINHFTGERCNQIVDGDIKTSGNDGKTTFELCKTEEEVFSKLNIKVDAAVDYAGAEIKARVDFAKELTRKRNTTTVLVFVEKSVSKTLTGPKFLPEVSTASVKDLVRAGGDSYMSVSFVIKSNGFLSMVCAIQSKEPFPGYSETKKHKHCSLPSNV